MKSVLCFTRPITEKVDEILKKMEQDKQDKAR